MFGKSFHSYVALLHSLTHAAPKERVVYVAHNATRAFERWKDFTRRFNIEFVTHEPWAKRTYGLRSYLPNDAYVEFIETEPTTQSKEQT